MSKKSNTLKELGTDYCTSNLSQNGIALFLINRISRIRTLPDDDLSEALHELMLELKNFQVDLKYHAVDEAARKYTFILNFTRTYQDEFKLKSTYTLTTTI